MCNVWEYCKARPCTLSLSLLSCYEQHIGASFKNTVYCESDDSSSGCNGKELTTFSWITHAITVLAALLPVLSQPVAALARNTRTALPLFECLRLVLQRAGGRWVYYSTADSNIAILSLTRFYGFPTVYVRCRKFCSKWFDRNIFRTSLCIILRWWKPSNHSKIHNITLVYFFLSCFSCCIPA